jgi:hypothetical protein
MSERLVGFRHLVSVFALFESVSDTVRRVDNFSRKSVSHGFFVSLS